MGRKTPPFPQYKEWTTARFWSFIRSGLRAKWNRWPPKYVVLEAARKVVRGKRHKYEYKCSQCSKWYKAKEVEVDHIEPAGRLGDFDDLPGFVERLFVGEDKLRVVCKPCHKTLTAAERKKDE